MRDEKARFLRGVRTLTKRDVVRGQYRGYRDTAGVDPASTVETYAAIRLRVDMWRWSDVPIIVRAGKCLPVKATEIIVELTRPPEKLFPTQHPHGNRLRFQIEPEVVIGLEVQSRKPGVEQFAVEDIELTAMRQAARNSPPHQRLLSAALRGEHDLFASQETIEEAWRIVDPILGNATPPTSTSAARGARPSRTASPPRPDGTRHASDLAPANLENDLKQSPFISQAVMYGDRGRIPSQS